MHLISEFKKYIMRYKSYILLDFFWRLDWVLSFLGYFPLKYVCQDLSENKHKRTKASIKWLKEIRNFCIKIIRSFVATHMHSCTPHAYLCRISIRREIGWLTSPMLPDPARLLERAHCSRDPWYFHQAGPLHDQDQGHGRARAQECRRCWWRQHAYWRTRIQHCPCAGCPSRHQLDRTHAPDYLQFEVITSF